MRNRDETRTQEKQKNILNEGLGRIRFNYSAAFSLAIVFIFAWALWHSRTFTFTARFFPMVVGIPVLIFAVIQFFLDLTGKGRKIVEDGHTVEYEYEVRLPKKVINQRTANVFAWTLGWFLGIWLFGFNLGAPLCTFLHLKFGEREKWPISLILSFVVWAFVYFVFDRFLHVPFPKGQIFLWTRYLF